MTLRSWNHSILSYTFGFLTPFFLLTSAGLTGCDPGDASTEKGSSGINDGTQTSEDFSVALIGLRKGATFDWLSELIKKKLVSNPEIQSADVKKSSKIQYGKSEILFSSRGLIFALIPVPKDCNAESITVLKTLGIPESQRENLLLEPVILTKEEALLLEEVRNGVVFGDSAKRTISSRNEMFEIVPKGKRVAATEGIDSMLKILEHKEYKDKKASASVIKNLAIIKAIIGKTLSSDCENPILASPANDEFSAGLTSQRLNQEPKKPATEEICQSNGLMCTYPANPISLMSDYDSGKEVNITFAVKQCKCVETQRQTKWDCNPINFASAYRRFASPNLTSQPSQSSEKNPWDGQHLR